MPQSYVWNFSWSLQNGREMKSEKKKGMYWRLYNSMANGKLKWSELGNMYSSSENVMDFYKKLSGGILQSFYEDNWWQYCFLRVTGVV